MNLLERIVLGIKTGALAGSILVSCDNIDLEKEGINIRNSVPVAISVDRIESKEPKDIFEKLYKLSDTSNNYKLWKKKYDKENKYNSDPNFVIIPVLKQIYENNPDKPIYQERHKYLKSLTE